MLCLKRKQTNTIIFEKIQTNKEVLSDILFEIGMLEIFKFSNTFEKATTFKKKIMAIAGLPS